MTGKVEPQPRKGKPFDPEEARVLLLEDSGYSRSVLMEVLRGIGIPNSHVFVQSPEHFVETPPNGFEADVILVAHATDTQIDLSILEEIRRFPNALICECPIIFLSAAATMSNIQKVRNAGADEFVARPVSSAQLRVKLKKVIENPQPFVAAPGYVGPCRRRILDDPSNGVRRRLDDFDPEADRDIPQVTGANELADAVSELRGACSKLSDERVGLVAHVREIAQRTMQLATQKNDKPLFQTAAAVKAYLDGVGSTHQIEPHVLETGVNALTQLSVLPDSYSSARKSVASLMTFAVKKKLAHYQKRKDGAGPDSEEELNQINEQLGLDVDLDDPSPKRRSGTR
ncbi:hypothetical protein [Ponticaulis sp.]|uniref:response regulator n=1 Tax=Ponticaulis sp. TaxID=2020902 RepID=UPI000B652252|nr:hypothetical protein [Ponticaulis sp.]MAI90179.1 hypothetical protein [Ponticaulis sp.]OUX99829.1 MAG: hypothetical protein CBB65_07040 [Hyphomonadaceae bacterium TMED5]|tara:strand:- start:142974 stop:144002 length:1029 start_codon:yes stop_codon:yes gene_type:complete